MATMSGEEKQELAARLKGLVRAGESSTRLRGSYPEERLAPATSGNTQTAETHTQKGDAGG